MWIGDLTLRLRNWIAEVAQDGPFGNHATLTDGLVSYWALDETSGTRYDSVVASGNDLTDNNTVGSVNSGPEGMVASFVAANSESLSVADNPTLAFGEAGEGCTLAVWTRLTGASSGYGQILGRGWSGGRPIEVATETGATTPLYFRIEAGGSVQTSTAYPQDSGWHLVLLWFDPSDKKARLSIDNGTPVVSTAAANAALDPTTAPFEIGGGTGGVGSITGNLGEAAIWNRVLTSDERTALFAQGNGLRYADLPADLKTGLVSWWELDEVSGVRYDSHGTNHLTDNNTVTSVVNAGGAMHNAAASFVAANSEYLSMASQTVAPAGAARTVSLWMKLSAGYLGGAVNPSLIKVGPNAGTHGAWLLYCSGTEPNGLINLYANGVLYAVGSGFISDDTWYHVVYTYDGVNSHKVYVNDVEKISATAADGGDATNFFIGTSPAGNWDGLQDEVGIWSRVLTSQERTDLFNSGAGLFYGD